jgi:GLPGLI family protein
MCRFPKLILILSVIFLQSCQIKKDDKAISQGTMKYSITYLEDEGSNPIISLMPSHLKMSFKNSSVLMEVEGWMGVFKTSFIKNGESNEAITLLKMLNKKYCYRSEGAEGYYGFSAYGNAEITFDGEIKDILNYSCKHAKVSLPEKDLSFDVFYTEEISIENPNEFTPYDKIPGVLMEFQIEINGISMCLNASEVLETEISDEVFQVPHDFEDVPREELEKIFSSLI